MHGIYLATQPLSGVAQDMRNFIAGNGFIVIAAGSAFGKMVLDLIFSIVNDLGMPLVYQASMSVPIFRDRLGTGSDNLYKDIKKQVHWMSLIRSTITFFVSLLVLYVMLGVLFRHLFEVNGRK